MHYNPDAEPHGSPNVLAALRALIPREPLHLHEALTIAELQANRLLKLHGIHDVPVPVEIVSDLPRIVVEYDPDLPEDIASGGGTWDSGRECWIICLNASEPDTRQRFTLLHEFKHIVDHGSRGFVPHRGRRYEGLEPVEYIADYFAGCVLMPKRHLKAAFFSLSQNPAELAELFDVSELAMTRRLCQLHLSDQPPALTWDGQQQPAPGALPSNVDIALDLPGSEVRA
ncbi:Zn-dependent peptidase ImmA, M78 family [Frankineae bacterium MT45]|nr:Zn-dependent peptidase ImmA, M78 family [Frankineae bacterium MT45]